MRDEERLCECGRFHQWGILRYSQDNTALYGPRPLPTCDNFRPKIDDAERALAASVPNLGEIWAQTQDLNPQATLATRIVVARLRSLGEVEKKKNGALARLFGSSSSGIQAIAAQWPEFIGFVISQITDMRGVLVRDETKFAHLVAHTDEIVEAMRGVTQLSARLKRQEELLVDIAASIERLQAQDDAEDEALRHFGLLEPEEDSLFDLRRFTPSLPTEPVVVESEPRHDDDESENGDSDEDENGNGDEDEE